MASKTASRPKTRPRPELKTRPRKQPPYQVVLLDDDDHSYEYVVQMLQKLFGHPPTKGFIMARSVDLEGRAVVFTTTKEHAELKRDQVHAYGPDSSIKTCKGSMSAVIEPVEE